MGELSRDCWQMQYAPSSSPCPPSVMECREGESVFLFVFPGDLNTLVADGRDDTDDETPIPPP